MREDFVKNIVLLASKANTYDLDFGWDEYSIKNLIISNKDNKIPTFCNIILKMREIIINTSDNRKISIHYWVFDDKANIQIAVMIGNNHISYNFSLHDKDFIRYYRSNVFPYKYMMSYYLVPDGSKSKVEYQLDESITNPYILANEELIIIKEAVYNKIDDLKQAYFEKTREEYLRACEEAEKANEIFLKEEEKYRSHR